MSNNKVITIWILCYNESEILQVVINHWKHRFPDGEIIIANNSSTDNSKEIAQSNGCSVVDFDSRGKFNDLIHLEVAKRAHQSTSTPFLAFVDCDELPLITQEELLLENELGTTIVKFEGWDLVNKDNSNNLLTYINWNGVRNHREDKRLIWKSSEIKDMRFDAGRHHALPLGNVKYSKTVYKNLHLKYISPEYIIERYKMYEERFDPYNRSLGHGTHYKQSKEQIIEEFKQLQEKAVKIL